MADINRIEMSRKYGRLSAGRTVGAADGKKSPWRKCFRFAIATALCLAVGSFLVSGACLWNQRKTEVENVALREFVGVLKMKIKTVEDKLSEMVPDARGSYEELESRSDHSRLRRSNNDPGRQNRRRPQNPSKAAHFRQDATDGSTINELKWKSWDETEEFPMDFLRLLADGKSVKISDSGLYFIYAQVHFENAKPRNAFAIRVDNAYVMKCFQSLDYFNQSLTSTENSRLKPCYSASVVVLRRNQVVSVVNLYTNHRIYNDPNANFWGFVKLADN